MCVSVTASTVVGIRPWHTYTVTVSDTMLVECVLQVIRRGAVADWVRELAWTGDRVVLVGFNSRCGNLIRFGTLAIPFTPLLHCLSQETLKDVGPFYLVSMPGPGAGEVNKILHQSAPLEM